MDPTGLARYEGYLAEVDETVLAGETLPTLTGNPGRINASCRATCTVASRTVRISAIPRSRYPQGSGYLERGIAEIRTVLLATVQVALQDALIRPGLPVRVGKVSPARTVSSTSARYPSYRARPVGSMAK